VSDKSRARRDRAVRSALIVLVVLITGVARAEGPETSRHEASAETASDSAPRAQQWFDQGRASMKAHRYEEACAEFSESFRLDRAAGTLLNLAACREAQGKTATAWKYYADGLRLSEEQRNADGARLATARLRVLEPLLCRLTITPSRGAPRGLEIRVDGAVLAENAWGRPLPVDPGPHRIEARAPGRVPWSSAATLMGESTTRVLEVPSLALEWSDVVSPGARRSGGFGWPVVAFGAAGAVAFGATAYFGVRASSEWNRRQEHCPEHLCDDEAVHASKQAATYARLADVSAGVGLVASGLAVYSALTAKRADAPARTGFALDVAPARIELWATGMF